MEVLRNEIVNYSTFQAKHLTEGQLVDSRKTDSQELKTTAERLNVLSLN